MLQTVLGVGRVSESVDTKYVTTYRDAEDIERRRWDGFVVRRGHAADAVNEETKSTCDALYPHVHAHARWSFSLRLGFLVLQKDAVRAVANSSPWCCRCEGACIAILASGS
jgi:hypothetical protein